MSDHSQVFVGLNAVILAVTEEEPRILTLRRGDHSVAFPENQKPDPTPAELVDALPFGPLDPARDRTLELALRAWVREQTGIEVGYVEQLYTFGDRNRDPREREGGPRVLSIGYLSLCHEDSIAGGGQARWRPWYDYLPWEDWRGGRPAILERHLEPALDSWIQDAEDRRAAQLRRERIDIAFGLGGAPWDGYRVLDRYELLYEAGLVREAVRDRGATEAAGEEAAAPRLGRPMCFDHRRILATAVSRLRGKIKYRPVVFELLPPTFTLLQLQRVVEALAGQPLHKQNFRRLVEKGGLVDGTGKLSAGTGGRPAELFRFRRVVLRERPTPGVGLPALPEH
ncbi:MAG: hypothetical protein GY719_42860 [bacterium]|nr:hypothetical protein [bacterium]